MKRLKELRNEMKLTTKELGEQLNLSQSTISMYESGKRQPDTETLKKIAKFFDVSIDYLLENNSKSTFINKPNTIKVIGRGGVTKEFTVTEEQRKAIETLLGNSHIDPDADI